MAPDNKPLPLPILLRVPWFPADLPATRIAPKLEVIDASGPSLFPVIVQPPFRAPATARPARRQRRVLALLLLAGLLTVTFAWFGWARPWTEDRDGSQLLAPRTSRAPTRTAYLLPVILPLDPGETP
jgi:hypothetical protein